MPDRLGDRIRIKHILDAILEIEAYTNNATKEEFLSNSMMFNATLRQLEVIGEASNRISTETLQNYPSIPWTRLIGLRNIVIHENFGVDELTIWSIIKINLPDLKKEVEKMISGF